MSGKAICAVCGDVLTDENKREFEGLVMCELCFEDTTVVCDCCGTRIYRNEAEGNSSIVLCNRCYNYNYTHCENCGIIIHNDNSYYDEDSDYSYCYECYGQFRDKPIKSYNYKPIPIFYGDDPIYLGVELEIDKGGECSENANVLLDIANRSEERIYCKHDGSINDGFEIVSHPMTLSYHLNEMNWEEIFKEAVAMDYRSHQTNTCGLHIHVGRSAFGKTVEEQEDAISRVVYFVENHWNELLKFSRRTEASINRWASRYGISTTAKDTYKNAKDKRMGRYVAVNLENFDTIEFRLFRGTLYYNTFIATLQLIQEVCRVAKNLSDKELEGMSWSDFVSKIPPDKKELIEYLKAKRLYVNEAEEESEEM